MCARRQSSIWPKTTSKTSIKNAFQIQYLLSDEHDSEGYVNVHAINIMDQKEGPYSWSIIPREFTGMFEILCWIQWSFSHFYSINEGGSKLIGGYILYLERIFDELWISIREGQFEIWSENYGSRWAQTQKAFGGHHSESYVMKGLSKEREQAELYLGLEVEHWEKESEVIVKGGFPGRDIFLEKRRFDHLTELEKNQVMEEVKDLLEEEERGRFS